MIGAGTSVSTAALETSTESTAGGNLMYSRIDVSNGPETLRSHQTIHVLRHEIDLGRRYVRVRAAHAADQKTSAVCICGAITGSERITKRIEDIKRN